MHLKGEKVLSHLTLSFICLMSVHSFWFLVVMLYPCLPLVSKLPDRSLSSTESEPGAENRVQRIPSLPKAFQSIRTPQHPVDSPSISFLSKTPQMTSSPLPSYRKVKYLCQSVATCVSVTSVFPFFFFQMLKTSWSCKETATTQ